MPESLELVGQRVSVAVVEQMPPDTKTEGVGAAFLVKQAIYVKSGHGPDQERDTLLHEVLHMLLRIVGIDLSERQEERVVTTLTPVLLDALRRNPGLVAFLVAP